MRTFLRDITIKGVKNLSEPIALVFAKKDISSFDELANSNIKAIYGPNGSGKTAVVQAFNILRNVLLRENYLQDSQTKEYLFTLLNKKCQCIEIALNLFCEEKNKDISIYSYEVHIGYVDGDFFITREVYSKRKTEYAKGNILLKTEKGILIEDNILNGEADDFLNLLDKSSFLSILLNKALREHVSPNKPFEKLWNICLFNFLLNITAVSDQQDIRINIVYKTPQERVKEMLDYSDLLFNSENFSDDKYNFKVIDQNGLNAYTKELKRKTEFLQIFNSKIKKIGFDKKLISSSEKEAKYSVNEFIVYEDYTIDLELESVGIKKLFNLYTHLKHLEKGGLLVIDELDSHINNVYLTKLIEYVSLYTKGQLIFTTHNVSPMDFLKTKKNSIDFLSISGKVSSWTQIGNYSPSNAYKTRMIKRLPFNLSAEDFLRVFRDNR